jgi:hypothetical protein
VWLPYTSPMLTAAVLAQLTGIAMVLAAAFMFNPLVGLALAGAGVTWLGVALEDRARS